MVEKRRVGLDSIVETPPHRVRHAGCRCVRDPYLKRAKVVFCRPRIYGFDAMVRPCAPVARGIPSQDFGSNRSDRVLLEIVGSACHALVRGFRRIVVVGSHDVEGKLKLDKTFV